MREFFADEAPRVVVVSTAAAMALHGPPFPWLDKPAAIVAASGDRGERGRCERGDLASVVEHGGRPRLAFQPRASYGAPQLERAVAPGPSTPGRRRSKGVCASCVRHAPSFPAGTFVFVLSDFVDAVVDATGVACRALHWDVTPVVIQDPTWEQSFPRVGGVLLPVADPEKEVGRRVGFAREARVQASANESRLGTILGGPAAGIRPGPARVERAGRDRARLPPLVGAPDAASPAKRMRRTKALLVALMLVVPPVAEGASPVVRATATPSVPRFGDVVMYTIEVAVPTADADETTIATDIGVLTRVGTSRTPARRAAAPPGSR